MLVPAWILAIDEPFADEQPGPRIIADEPNGVFEGEPYGDPGPREYVPSDLDFDDRRDQGTSAG